MLLFRTGDKGDDVLDGHAVLARFLAPPMLEDQAGCLLHCREGTADEMVGIDDHPYIMFGKFLFIHCIERGRNNYNGDMGKLLAEDVTEGKDLIRFLPSAMDHHRVGSCVHIRPGPCQGIIHALVQDQAFDAGDDHEILGLLSLFACSDLLAEILYGVLLLQDIGAEEGVLLQPYLILDDNRRYPDPLQGLHIEDKMLQLATGVTVKDDGLGRHFHDLIDGTQA